MSDRNPLVTAVIPTRNRSGLVCPAIHVRAVTISARNRIVPWSLTGRILLRWSHWEKCATRASR